jgi:hypothetical protein
MSRKLTNEENEKGMIGSGICRETWKNVENRETHTVGPGKWRDALKDVKYEKSTLWYLDFGEKPEKCGK